MSLFSWLSREKPAKEQAENSQTSRTVPDRLPPGAREGGNRKTERMARRELLYSVIRESMARAGVLSASYRFKVLSLDAAGRQFLIMIDLASNDKADWDMQTEIEAAIVQRAKSRHELTVSAVYWRRNDQVGVGAQRAPAVRQQGSAQPAPSQPAELEPESEPPPVASPVGRAGFDPIQAEEMEAFRAALANGIGSSGQAPLAEAAAPREKNYTLLTGFEDTELKDQSTRTLSATQSGDLT